MRQSHAAGEKVFVDFDGDTIDVIAPVTGVVQPIKLFVAALGASSYTYAEARASEGSPTGSAATSACSPSWAR